VSRGADHEHKAAEVHVVRWPEGPASAYHKEVTPTFTPCPAPRLTLIFETIQLSGHDRREHRSTEGCGPTGGSIPQPSHRERAQPGHDTSAPGRWSSCLSELLGELFRRLSAVAVHRLGRDTEESP
jgi:hypothetical protein